MPLRVTRNERHALTVLAFLVVVGLVGLWLL